MNLINVNDLWTNKVMGLLQDVRETSIDDQTIHLALFYTKLYMVD